MKLNKDLVQLSAGSSSLSNETVLLTYDKNITLTMFQLQGKFSVLKDRLSRNKFIIQITYECIDNLSTRSITPTLIHPPDLRQLLYYQLDQLRSHPRLSLPTDQERYTELI